MHAPELTTLKDWYVCWIFSLLKLGEIIGGFFQREERFEMIRDEEQSQGLNQQFIGSDLEFASLWHILLALVWV